MAGIYVHIPFCRQVCNYCDFHFSVSQKNRDPLIDAIIKEIELQKDYLKDEKIETIYFGGGTPSLLPLEKTEAIVNQIHKFFNVREGIEFTTEANPDDIQSDYLKGLIGLGVNRLSIGVQSFKDENLAYLNRSHSGQQAFDAIRLAQVAGFHNITIDLMYGYPTLSMSRWIKDLRTAFELEVQHISAYHMTIEPKTVFGHQLKKGSIKPIDEVQSNEQFKKLMTETANNLYIHYEISNFARPGFLSKHNTNYWLQNNYLGIGPSAHSYNGYSRQWNVAVNAKYIESINKGIVPYSSEELDQVTRYNEYVMTALRTMWGASLSRIKEEFGREFLEHSLEKARVYINEKNMELKDHALILTKKGKFIADLIIEDFFMAN